MTNYDMAKGGIHRRFTLGLLTEWRALGLPFERGPVILAISGGADSCALACAVSDLSGREKFKNEFVIAHFDHGLRQGVGEKEAGFVRSLASDLGFEFVFGQADDADYSKEPNLEQAARRARYGFLHAAAGETGAIGVLTAHTMDDQAETFLMNLIRGSGLDGLTAMMPMRSFGFSDSGSLPRDENCETDANSAGEGSGVLFLARPMLRWASRSDTEAFAKRRGIEYLDDPMNEDPAFTRVRIRKQVLPLLKKLNPEIVRVLSGTAQIIGDDLALLESVADREIAIGLGELGPRLRIRDLLSLPVYLLPRAIRAWLLRNRGNLRGLERKHITAIQKLAGSKKSGRTVELPNAERVVRKGGMLVFGRVKVEK